MKGESPLDLAAQYGRLETVEVMLKSHPELIHHYFRTHSPLHLASRNGHKQVVQVLLDAGMDVNLQVGKPECGKIFSRNKFSSPCHFVCRPKTARHCKKPRCTARPKSSSCCWRTVIQPPSSFCFSFSLKSDNPGNRIWMFRRRYWRGCGRCPGKNRI